MKKSSKFKLVKEEQIKNQTPLFTIIPAKEEAKNYILMQSKTIDNLQEIIKRLQEESEELKQKVCKH